MGLLLTSISAILLGLSMPRAGPNVGALEWISLIPWFIALREAPPRTRFFLSLWMGILFWAITVYWLYLVTALGFFAFLPYLGLYFAVFGLAMGDIFKRKFLPYFACPLLWIFLEFLRGRLLGGFPWLNLAHGQYLNIPLLPWASLGGEGLISGLIILVNLIALNMFFTRGRKRVSLCSVFFALMTFLHLGGKFLLNREEAKPAGVRPSSLRVAVIQPNITLEKWDKNSQAESFYTLLSLGCESLKDKPNLIIWPETSFSYDLEEEKTCLEQLKKLSRENNCFLLVGSVKELPGGKFYNRAILLAPSGEIDSYDKVRLVPFGEYVPLGEKWPAWERWIEKIAGYKPSCIPGKELKTLQLEHIGNFGVLICFEDIFPGISRGFKKKGAKFLVNMTDDHWYGHTSAPYQHLAASVFRAAENRLPLIRSANTGLSCFIDAHGRITSMVKDNKERAIFIQGYTVREVCP